MPLPKPQDLYAAFNKMSARERTILYAVGIIVSIAVLDRLVVAPIAGKVSELDKEIRSKEAGIKKDLRIISQKDKIQNENARYGPLLSGSKSDDEEVTAILREIERLSNKSSIYLVDMKPGGIKNVGPTTKKYLINLSCEAQMDQLIEFMFNVESSRKLLSIEKYQISPKTKQSSLAQCSMTISKMTMQDAN